MKSMLVFVFLMLAATPAVFAQKTASARRSADRLVARADRFSNSRKQEVYADVSETGRVRWRRFASVAAHERWREKSETYTIAYVWRKTGEFAKVAFTSFSESGDWAEYLTLYYRGDGRLVRSSFELRSFYCECAIKDDRWFGNAGRLLKSRKRYSDLDDKPMRADAPSIREVEPYKSSVPNYARFDKLPFYRLTKR